MHDRGICPMTRSVYPPQRLNVFPRLNYTQYSLNQSEIVFSFVKSVTINHD